MKLRSKMTKSIVLAGIPLLTLPLLAESGMSRDRSHRDDGGRSQSNEQIIQGEISKKKGDEITLRTSNGERITFRINDQTNQLCPQGTQTSQKSSEGKSSSMTKGSSMGKDSSSSGQSSSGKSQMAKGSTGQSSSDLGQTSSSSLFGSQSGQASNQSSLQDSSSGQGSSMSGSGDQILSSSQSASAGSQSGSQNSGFKFGECNFQNGDSVKAKIDRQGNATFVRSMGRNGDNYFSAGRMGDDYFVLPAGELGGLDISDKDSHYAVKSTDGEKIGEVHRIMTSGNGDLSYAIIKKKDGQLISVPWQALEGVGNKTFKLKVTQSQLGNLPILEEDENSVQHVQKHWDLTDQEQQRLGKWNQRLNERNKIRDRYTEDTPTFTGNRQGYDRYDSDQGRSSSYRGNDEDASGMSQHHYQDQSFDDSQVKHYGFSPAEYPPPSRAPSYERDDRQRSYDRNRQAYDRRDQGRSSRYRDSDEGASGMSQRHYQDQSFDDSQVKHYGFSPAEYPPPSRAPSYEGDDRQRSYDRNRQKRSSDDFRNRGDQRSMYSQSRERDDHRGGGSDRYQTTAPRSDYDPQRRGDDRYQSRRSGGSDYDYRPEGYRP